VNEGIGHGNISADLFFVDLDGNSELVRKNGSMFARLPTLTNEPGRAGQFFVLPRPAGSSFLRNHTIIMTTESKKSQFLLLLRHPTGGRPAPEDLQKIMARFAVWMKSLNDKGMVVGTNGLELTGKVLRGPRGVSATDGPYPEAKEIVGGYVLITAGSFDEAVEAARECPGLDNQMVVEVRPVRPQSKN